MKNVIVTLQKSWSADTAYESNDWTLANPARGQCAVTSLIIQDFFGGDIVRFAVESNGVHEKHYANIIKGTLIDVTRSQYPDTVVLVISNPDLGDFSSLRERMLSDDSTKRRYEALKQRVIRKLDNQ